MIHQIRIKNYKSLKDVTVDLSPVTVFIGKSGTGKTNFISAVRFLRELLLHGPQVAEKFPLYQCATNPNGATEFIVAFKVPAFKDMFTYTLSLHEKNLQFPQKESLVYGDQTIFSQKREQRGQSRWESEPALIPIPNAGPIALGRLPGLEKAVIAYTALTHAIGVYVFPFDVLKKSGQKNGVPGLSDDGLNFLEVIREIIRDLQDIVVGKAIAASLRKINETVTSVNLDSLQNPQKAIVGHSVGDKTLVLDLKQESDGFRRFYVHLLALYQKPPKQTLMFEEPENGIYPAALSLLADEFKAAPDAGRGQVLLTTHNPALLDCFTADQIRVVELVNLETQIGPLADEQKETVRNELLHPGELLTIDPARRQ